MECKFLYHPFCAFKNSELIETLWNVNQNALYPIQQISAELIETLWNVNANILCAQHLVEAELIETLWNVNAKGDESRCQNNVN